MASWFQNSLMILTIIKYVVILIQLITIPIIIHKVFGNLTATLVVAFVNFIITIPVIIGDKMFFVQMKQLGRQITRLSIENADYARLNKSLAEKISTLKINNTKYQKLNAELGNSLSRLDDRCAALKSANKKLLIIQKQSQELLNNLMNAGDEFKEFGNILNTAVNKNLNLTDKLSVLLNGLSGTKFAELDKNKDGVVSANEFSNYFN